MKKLSLFASFTVAMAAVSVASAADMDSVPFGESLPMTQPVEVGSGWYLRGDINYSISAKVKATEWAGSESWRHEKDLKNQVMPSIGIGYQFTDNLRGDITAGYLKQNFKDNVDIDGSVRVWDMMANGYYDIGNFSGFTPYVGAGLGFANVRYKADLSSGLKIDSDSDYRFAWALMAGVAIDVTSNVKVDLGYRFSDISGGDMLSLPGYQIRDDSLRSHQLRAGLRFTTW